MHELDQVYLEGMIPWNRIRKEIDNFRNLETWYYFEQCKHYGRQKAKRKRLIYGRLQVTYDHQPYQDGVSNVILWSYRSKYNLETFLRQAVTIQLREEIRLTIVFFFNLLVFHTVSLNIWWIQKSGQDQGIIVKQEM